MPVNAIISNFSENGRSKVKLLTKLKVEKGRLIYLEKSQEKDRSYIEAKW